MYLKQCVELCCVAVGEINHVEWSCMLQAVSVPGESSVSQAVQTLHQVTAVLLARHHHGFLQHLHAHLRAPSPASVAR